MTDLVANGDKPIKKSPLTPSTVTSFFRPLILAGFVTAVAYQLFFLCAPFIWSLNITLPIHDYVPAVRPFIREPRNGMQLYALYGLVHLIFGGTFLLYLAMNKMASLGGKRRVLLAFTVVSLIFFWRVGFTPPMEAHSFSFLHDRHSIYFMMSVLGITGFLTLFVNKPRILALLLVILLFPICMVASGAYSVEDYNYILYPAIRILRGFALNQTGFQYDHLLSLIAALWIKLGFSIYDFSRVAQISVYVFFVGLYLFASRLFTHRCYALYLVIGAVLVRMYGNIGDMIQCFQVTPLRLDWWFAVLLAVFYKDTSHWLTGVTLGFLLLFHHAFGEIYTLAYVLCVLILFGLEVASKKEPWTQVLRYYAIRYAKNVLLIICALVLYRLFFAFGEQSTSIYRKHGIGFIRISGHSFYWYVPVLLSLVFILNWRNRSFRQERYFQTTLLLILLAIGNSLYFFGRSHENNIINISSILLLCLFLLLDLVHCECERGSVSRFSKWVLPTLAVLGIAGTCWAYSGRAPARFRQQIAHFRAHDYDGREQMGAMLHWHTGFIAQQTHHDPNVVFLSGLDAYYYDESGYVPRSSSSVMTVGLFMKDLVAYLNAQLLKGYYVAMPMQGVYSFGEALESLQARNKVAYPSVVIFSNNDIG